MNVGVSQGLDENGDLFVRVLVTPLFALVDNSRYRVVLSGDILGIDFRKQFIGVNGLTGDGQTVVSGATPYPEPGGLGYTAEFIIRDRPAITSRRTLTYDPLVDGILPESGQTTTDPAKLNTSLYNPPSSPSTAVGLLSAFGSGIDGHIAVTSGTMTIDTGNRPNAPLGKPFTVTDLNPNDVYDGVVSSGPLTYDSLESFELNLQSLTIASLRRIRR